MSGNVFDIKMNEPKKEGGNYVYTIYNRTKYSHLSPISLKENQYLARIEISKSTGEVKNIIMGTREDKSLYSPDDVRKIINTSSYIASSANPGNRILTREDPAIYLSIILSNFEIKQQQPKSQHNQSVDIRFPIYSSTSTGSNEPSKTAQEIIDRYFSDGKNDGKTLLIPYGVNGVNAVDGKNRDNGENRDNDGHIALLIVKKNPNFDEQRRASGQKRYIIQCFDNSLTFFDQKKGTRGQDLKAFGSLTEHATISQLNTEKLITYDSACSYYVEAFIKLALSKSDFLRLSGRQIQKDILDTIESQVKDIKSEIPKGQEIQIAGETISTETSEYKGTAYQSSKTGDKRGFSKLSEIETKESTESQKSEPPTKQNEPQQTIIKQTTTEQTSKPITTAETAETEPQQPSKPAEAPKQSPKQSTEHTTQSKQTKEPTESQESESATKAIKSFQSLSLIQTPISNSLLTTKAPTQLSNSSQLGTDDLEK